MVDIKLGPKPRYEDEEWNQYSPKELTPQMQQMADHLGGWFRQQRWLLDTVYSKQYSPGWTELAFVFEPTGFAKINRLAQHLNINKELALKTLLKIPKEEVRDGGILDFSCTKGEYGYGTIHPKTLGPIKGHHGVALREAHIEKIDQEKATFLTELPNPYVTSWVNFHALPLSGFKKDYFTGKEERQYGLSHNTKIVFVAHLANVTDMINEEMARRLKKQVTDKGEFALFQGVLEHFKGSKNLLSRKIQPRV
jgi:hypothetical protein